MMNENEFKREFLDGFLRNQLQLMLGYFLARFVFDSVDFPPVLSAANNSPKIDYRAGRNACPGRTRRIDVVRWRFELRLRQ